jgi:hypothetical protein
LQFADRSSFGLVIMHYLIDNDHNIKTSSDYTNFYRTANNSDQYFYHGETDIYNHDTVNYR